MSIFLKNQRAQEILDKFNTDIAAKLVKTWIRSGTVNYVHDTTQWKDAAYFHAAVETEGVRLTLLAKSGQKVTRACYAELHGSMTYAMIYHCWGKVYAISVTEDPRDGDTPLSV